MKLEIMGAENRIIGPSMRDTIQRRTSPRIKFSCMAHFRRPDAGPVSREWLCATQDFSRDSLYFVADEHGLSESMLLIMRFPYHLDPSIKDSDYLVEVTRIDSLRQGRCGVGARLVPRIPLRLQDGLLVMNTEQVQQSWPEEASRRIDLYI